MATRRNFLGGLMASGFAPRVTWAEAGSPDFLSAGKAEDGRHHLFGLTAEGQVLFRFPLPGRGHAGAAHPAKPEAVAFARRPGTFAFVVDCLAGVPKAELKAPEGRHFYGHGAYSGDGSLLFTTENDYEVGEGRVGVWDARASYVRIDEFSSGGVGPHEIRLMPDGESLVIANGGIETHPDSGRAKLNLATMQPNVAIASLGGRIQEIASLGPDHRFNSIRHLDVRPDGLIVFGMQWQGESGTRPSVVGLLRQGQLPDLVELGSSELGGYVGSVCYLGDGSRFAVSSPRSGKVVVFDLGLGAGTSIDIADVCGLGAVGDALILTSGESRFAKISKQGTLTEVVERGVLWDNHLVRVS